MAAVYNVLAGPYADEASVTTILGSGNNRCLALLVYQVRSPPNVSGVIPTFNGVSGHVVAEYALSTRCQQLVYWLDSELPASGGTYTLSWAGTAGGINASLLECTGISQTSPVRTYSTNSTGVVGSGTSLSITASTQSGDLMIGAFYQGAAGSTISGDAGTSAVYASTSVALFYGIDSGGHTLDLSPVRDGATQYWTVAALASSSTAQTITPKSAFYRMLQNA